MFVCALFLGTSSRLQASPSTHRPRKHVQQDVVVAGWHPVATRVDGGPPTVTAQDEPQQQQEDEEQDVQFTY